MSASSHSVEYVLTGAVAGATEQFGGINFIEGRAIVSPQAHDNIGSLLRRSYSAKPVNECTPEELRASPGRSGTGASPASLNAGQIRQMIASAVAEALESEREKHQKEIAALRNDAGSKPAAAAQEEAPTAPPLSVEDDIAPDGSVVRGKTRGKGR